MTPPPSLTASTESLTYNDANSDKKNDDGKTLKKEPIGRLLSLNKPEKSVLMLGSLAAAIHGAIGLGTVSMVSRLANGFLFATAGGKLIERVRALAFQSIVHQEIAWFDDPINSRSVTRIF
jgi:ATP-binding cassette subfamily B (MDR/TAP) protein 1